MRTGNAIEAKGRAEEGLTLLETVLALTVFVVAITSLFGTLQKINENSNTFARDRLIQYGLESILTEAKHLPVQEMTLERRDEELGVTYRTTVENLALSNVDGDPLEDLYTLRAEAIFEDSYGEQTEVAEIYIYKEEDR